MINSKTSAWDIIIIIFVIILIISGVYVLIRSII
jgi:hypothetical protein